MVLILVKLPCVVYLVKNDDGDGGDFQFLLVVSEGWKPRKGVAKNLPWLSVTFPNHECKFYNQYRRNSITPEVNSDGQMSIFVLKIP